MAQRKSPPSGKGSSGKPGAAKKTSGSSGAAKVSMSKSSGAEKVSTSKLSGAAKVSTSKPAAKTSGTKAAGSKTSSKPAGTKPAGSKTSSKPAAKATGKSGTRPTKAAAKSAAARKNASGRPPNKRKPKSIVNQKQKPWGLIATTIAVVVFAAVVVIGVVATHKSGDNLDTTTTGGGQRVNASDPYRQPELAAAKKIKGLTYTVQGQHTHQIGHIKYEQSPPVGGNHNAFWADCTGTVYGKPIANENAVHMLEHGGIWITYNADQISGAKLTELKKYVEGVNFTALSPYPDLKTPISLQAWGYQLAVNSPTDPRIAQFISTLKLNKATTPEFGSSCSNPAFKKSPSTFDHPKSSP